MHQLLTGKEKHPKHQSRFVDRPSSSDGDFFLSIMSLRGFYECRRSGLHGRSSPPMDCGHSQHCRREFLWWQEHRPHRPWWCFPSTVDAITAGSTPTSAPLRRELTRASPASADVLGCLRVRSPSSPSASFGALCMNRFGGHALGSCALAFGHDGLGRSFCYRLVVGCHCRLVVVRTMAFIR